MASPAFVFSTKAPDAFRTISEVAADLELPQHVLRFWESRFTQLKPVKRAGGRRYYRPDDIDLLRGIRALLYSDGLTIKGVQKLLKDRGIRHVAQIGRGARFSVAARLPPMPMPVEQRILPVRPEAQPLNLFQEAEGLAEMERVKLELLLGELLRLRARLRARRR